MPYTQNFTVRWSECDANGHARSTAYSEYGVETRMGFLAQQGFPFARFVDLGIGPVVLHEEIDYLRELRLGDTVVVDLQRLGLSPDGARWMLAHDFRRPDGQPAAHIVLAGGWLDLGTRKLIAPPDDLRRAMEAVSPGGRQEELESLKR